MYIILIGLFIKHFFADFVFQTPYQYLNKGNLNHPGGYLHAGIHALLSFLVISYVFVPNLYILFLVILEFVIHYWMDFTKVNVCKKKEYTPTTSEKWFWWLGFDQTIHSLTYILIIAMLGF